MRPRAWIVVAVLVFAAPAGAAQERVTLDTLVDRGLAEATGTPSYVWLDDGTALLYDRRVPAAQRTLERLEPASGRRTPAVDAGKVLASWAAVLSGDEQAPPTLPWPTELHRSGKLALYQHLGDLFLLDLTKVSVTRLTQTPEEEVNPRLSPDGRAVSFVRGSDLYLWTAEQGERPLTQDGSATLRNGSLSWVYWEEIFGREDLATWWSPDSTAIAFLQTDESGVSESFFPEFEPATPTVIRQRYPKAGEPNPKVRLGIVELGSGAVTWASLGEPAPEYVVRVDWLPDGQRLAVQTLDRRQQNLHLLLVDRHSGASRPLLHESSPTNLNIHDDLRFLDGGRRFLWVSERSGHACLYLYSDDGTLLRQLTQAPLHLRASSGGVGARRRGGGGRSCRLGVLHGGGQGTHCAGAVPGVVGGRGAAAPESPRRQPSGQRRPHRPVGAGPSVQFLRAPQFGAGPGRWERRAGDYAAQRRSTHPFPAHHAHLPDHPGGGRFPVAGGVGAPG